MSSAMSEGRQLQTSRVANGERAVASGASAVDPERSLRVVGPPPLETVTLSRCQAHLHSGSHGQVGEVRTHLDALSVGAPEQPAVVAHDTSAAGNDSDAVGWPGVGWPSSAIRVCGGAGWQPCKRAASHAARSLRTRGTEHRAEPSTWPSGRGRHRRSRRPTAGPRLRRADGRAVPRSHRTPQETWARCRQARHDPEH